MLKPCIFFFTQKRIHGRLPISIKFVYTIVSTNSITLPITKISSFVCFACYGILDYLLDESSKLHIAGHDRRRDDSKNYQRSDKHFRQRCNIIFTRCVHNQFPENLIFVLDSFGKSYFQGISNSIRAKKLSNVVLRLYNSILKDFSNYYSHHSRYIFRYSLFFVFLRKSEIFLNVCNEKTPLKKKQTLILISHR